jgi:hypothetical protein
MSSAPYWFKVLEFLARYNPEAHTFIAPYATTQYGIGESVGISRAHASIVLKQLMQMQYVECRLLHVQQINRRRRTYFLTGIGKLALINKGGDPLFPPIS